MASVDFEKKGKQLRRDIIEMLYRAKSGHTGGSLSMVEIMMALYYEVMNISKDMMQDDNRDRFILSKGHGCPCLYAVLADLGFINKEDLKTLRKINSHLPGHPDHNKTFGIEVNTGSLGQGASISIGIALANKLKKNTSHVYTILGDGECQEGIVWEASMAAAHYKLDNLTFIIDNNGLQIDGTNDEVMSLGKEEGKNLLAKFKAFGFDTYEVDGHNVNEIIKALKESNEQKNGCPKLILAHTIKGKGVSFMENQASWHGVAPKEEDYKKAMLELEDK